MITSNLVVVLLACVVAALMSSHRTGGRYRRGIPDADILSPAPLDDYLDGGSDQ